MTYLLLFMPSLLALTAWLLSLRYKVSKNGMVIGFVTVMAVFLFVNDKLPLYSTINTIVLAFVAVYFTVLLSGILKEKKSGPEND